MRLPAALLLAWFLACFADFGCSSPAHGEVGENEDALQAIATLHFKADGSFEVVGRPRSGRSIQITYDDGRMPTCRGEASGGPAWTVTAFVRVDGEDLPPRAVAGHSGSGHIDNKFSLPAKVERSHIEIWFQNTSRWGCSAWDSNYGRNFHVYAEPSPEAPAWIGNVNSVLSRRTCNGACDDERRPVSTAPVVFDSWTRQRAAIAELAFQVYKPSVTDWDNPDLWRQLDVRAYVHWRGTASAPQMRYVSLDRRVGNDARYRVELRALDPFANRACPAAMEWTGDTVAATAEVFFTVNGVELRPSPGKAYTLRFTDGRRTWEHCGR